MPNAEIPSLSACLALLFPQSLLQFATLRGSHALLDSFLSWFPRAMHCDEQLWHMRHTTACDPKQKYMTDRYQKGGCYAHLHKHP